MRPLRLELQGFMTFARRATFDFRNEWLWTVTGPNGAGKSSLFDAMTFVFYGRHRGGAQNEGALMTQGCDYTRVAFDFTVGQEAFRVERILERRQARRGETIDKTWQAYALDVSAPSGEPHILAKVPDTSSANGLEHWVEKQLGLKYEAFTSSVLLIQGKADQFLIADARRRSEVLMQILDLAPYKQLEEKTRKRIDSVQANLQSISDELKRVEHATDDALSAAEDRRRKLEIAFREADSAVDRSTTLLTQARRFFELNGEVVNQQGALSTIEALLADDKQIQRAASEHYALEGALPLLRGISTHRSTIVARSVEAQKLRDEVATIDIESLSAKQLEHRGQAEDQEVKLRSARQLTRDAREQAKRIGPLAQAGRDIAALEASAHGLAEELDCLKPKLAEAPKAEKALRTSDAAARSLDGLKRLRGARANQVTARNRIDECDRVLPELDAQLAAVRDALGTARAAETEARKEAARQRENAALLRGSIKNKTEERDHRKEAEDEGTCSFCGQPVDAAHIRREIAVIEQALHDLNSQLRGISQLVQSATGRENEQAGLASELEAKLEAAQTAWRKTDLERQQSFADVARAERDARAALAVLTDEYRDEAQNESYPTNETISAVELLARQQPARAIRFQELQQTIGQFIVLERRQGEVLKKLAEIRSAHSDEDLAGAVLRSEELHGLVEKLEADEVAEEAQHQCLLGLVDASARAVAEATSARDEIAEKVRVAEAESDKATAAYDALCRQLVDPYAALATAPLDQFADSVVLLEKRFVDLSSAPELWQALEDARSRVGMVRSRIAELNELIATIPNAARIDVELAESNAADARRLRDEHHSQLGEAIAVLAGLQEAARLREDLLERQRCGQTLHDDLRTLNGQFGRKGLQGALVQEAQEAICHAANGYLAQTSAGMLRINLVPSPDGLQIMVSDLASAREPLAVEFISGSQRFRVAVALALAIGQYSGSGARDIRSVMVDEGFGSLDRDGRRSMIAMVKGLERILDCVILVSHQEEFQDAFPNGYHILKDNNGCSAPHRRENGVLVEQG